MASKLPTRRAAALFSILLSLNPFTHLLLLQPPPIPGSRDLLHNSRIIPVTRAFGPESIAFDPNGRGPYISVADGRILRWEGDNLGWVDFAVTTSQRKECVEAFAPNLEHVCGRPLGLRFDKKTGDLYIADAYFGLYVVGPAGGLSAPVVTEANGQPFRFTNDMDIDEEEDVIYFTDTSTDYYRRQFMSSILSGDKTGKLMKYNRSTKQLTVLLQDLAFANGVSLSKDRSFALVAETSRCRILRLWLKGPDSGKCEVFMNLPGFPDNIRRNQNGDFWVALHAKKGFVSKWCLSLGNFLLKLPLSFKQLHSVFVGGSHATILRVSEGGDVLEVLEDKEGKTVKFPSEVEERDDKLWIGSVMMPFISVYDRNYKESAKIDNQR